MSFYPEFFRALTLRPFGALAALYWYSTRRRVRGRNRLRRITSKSRYVYEIWMDSVEGIDEILAGAPLELEGWSAKPLVSFVLHVPADADVQQVIETVKSVKAQCYPEWELLLVGVNAPSALADVSDARVRLIAGTVRSDIEAVELALANVRGGHFMPMVPGMRLSWITAYLLAQCLREKPHATIIYGDQDRVERSGRRSMPWFKPEWNSELFLAQDYLTGACLISVESARSVEMADPALEGAANYALALAVSALPGSNIVHLPKVITHLANTPGMENQAARVAVVERQVSKSGGSARGGRFGSVRVSWPLPTRPPKVSIIIPTKDKPALLRACVESLCAKTDYADYEVLVIDNGSTDEEACCYLDKIAGYPNFRVINFPGEFNFSAINNYAISQSSGDYVCLLNNDTEICSSDWLGELMRYAVRDDVGAAGAKLLYPDGLMQHAGVVLGLGGAAGHAHRNLPDDQPGYFCRAHVTHFVSAVTAACLVVAKSKFETVGGLDVEGFKVAFNDVDFCLKLERAGWRNVYVPHSVLVHHESKSRGSDQSRQNLDRYLRELNLLQARWNTATYSDPLHHPNLDRASETYFIRL